MRRLRSLIHLFYLATYSAAICYSCHSGVGAVNAAFDTSQEVLGSDNSSPLSSDSYRHAKGFIALGDSYSAGIGTGLDGNYLTSEGDCRLGQDGYPLLLHKDLDNVTSSNTSFQWLSCSGSRTTDMLAGSGPRSQIDQINTSLPIDFATLSVGGNDLLFFPTINACIFRFYSFYSGTCEEALNASDAVVASPGFELRLAILLQEMLDAVGWEKRPRFSITVTGYARFFNAETPACDNMTFGVWYGETPPMLTREVRGRMNSLVIAANDKLRRTVESINARFAGSRPRVLLADYDALFEGHRFCEPGVLEPAYDRLESWFFLVGGPDNARNESTWPNGTNGDPELSRHRRRRQSETVLAPDSALVDPAGCLPPAQRRGDWGELALCYMAMAKDRNPSLRPLNRGLVPMNGMWWVPTYYGKTFHPRSLGCEGIRDRIYNVWQQNGL
ncbi:unnamed protein product [Discula destructiva]